MDLLKHAAGWLGWTQQEVLKSDVNFLLAALDGRLEMLRALFGSNEDPPQKHKNPTKQEILQFVRTNNALMRKGKIRKAEKG